MNQKKKAGTYSLIKGTGKIKQISKLFQAYCKDTNEIWHAKIIEDTLIKQYGLQENIQFNQFIYEITKDKENIICVKEVFQKNKNTFIIQEKYDTTLIQEVEKNHPMPSEEIQTILNEVVHGLLELYNSGYYTKSLRPEHIVCVDMVWKIQSFVLNEKAVPVESEFVWTNRFASPEEKYNNGKIEVEKGDEQIVWQIGILALYMLLGEDFKYEKIFKDNDIDWQLVKKICSNELYQLLTHSLKTKYDQRIRIRNLLSLKIFKDLDLEMMAGFQSQSKFFNPKSAVDHPKQKKSPALKEEDVKIWNDLKNDIERFKFFGEVDKYVQEVKFKNSFDMALLRYLSYRICYDNLKKIEEESFKWVMFDERVSGNENLEFWISNLKLFVHDIEREKNKNQKLLGKAHSSKTSISIIRQYLYTSISDDNTSYSKVVQIYLRVIGEIYTTLTKQIDKYKGQDIERTICYYSFCAYLLHTYNKEQLGIVFYKQSSVLDIVRYVEMANILQLRELSQTLLQKYFQTMNV